MTFVKVSTIAALIAAVTASSSFAFTSSLGSTGMLHGHLHFLYYGRRLMMLVPQKHAHQMSTTLELRNGLLKWSTTEKGRVAAAMRVMHHASLSSSSLYSSSLSRSSSTSIQRHGYNSGGGDRNRRTTNRAFLSNQRRSKPFFSSTPPMPNEDGTPSKEQDYTSTTATPTSNNFGTTSIVDESLSSTSNKSGKENDYVAAASSFSGSGSASNSNRYNVLAHATLLNYISGGNGGGNVHNAIAAIRISDVRTDDLEQNDSVVLHPQNELVHSKQEQVAEPSASDDDVTAASLVSDDLILAKLEQAISINSNSSISSPATPAIFSGAVEKSHFGRLKQEQQGQRTRTVPKKQSFDNAAADLLGHCVTFQLTSQEKRQQQQQQQEDINNNDAESLQDHNNQNEEEENAMIIIAEGIIIAQRHPIAFVYVNENQEYGSGSSSSGSILRRMCLLNDDTKSAQDSQHHSRRRHLTVNVLHNAQMIYPNDSWIGKIVDSAFLLSSGVQSEKVMLAANHNTVMEKEQSQKLVEKDTSTSFPPPPPPTSYTSIIDTEQKNRSGRAIFAPIPQVKDIALINTPLITGFTMVDALTPIGRGQNMLVIGEGNSSASASTSSQRDLAIGTVASQIILQGKERGARCIYASTSPDRQDRLELLSKLQKAKILDDMTVVSLKNNEEHAFVTNDESSNATCRLANAAEAIVVAASACSIAEYWAHTEGRDCLVVIDSLDHHQTFWDFTTRELVHVYGMDAVVKDDASGGASSEMRAFYSSLIQRAGKFKSRYGGGSVTLILLINLPIPDESDIIDGRGESGHFTADDYKGFNAKIQQRLAVLSKQGIPITAAVLKKLQIPIPPAKATIGELTRANSLRYVDDLSSMSDGHIWLSNDVTQKNQYPPLDPQKSITRIGIGADTESRADAPALRNVAGGLRFELAQAAALEGVDDPAARKQLCRRDAWMLAMHQDVEEIRSLSDECLCLLAARNGHLDEMVGQGVVAGTKLGNESIRHFLDHMSSTEASIVKEINETADLSTASRIRLDESVRFYFAKQKSLKLGI